MESFIGFPDRLIVALDTRSDKFVLVFLCFGNLVDDTIPPPHLFPARVYDLHCMFFLVHFHPKISHLILEAVDPAVDHRLLASRLLIKLRELFAGGLCLIPSGDPSLLCRRSRLIDFLLRRCSLWVRRLELRHCFFWCPVPRASR